MAGVDPAGIIAGTSRGHPGTTTSGEIPQKKRRPDYDGNGNDATPKRPRRDEFMPGSPTGNPDIQTAEVWGKKLPKKIMSTDWAATKTHGLAGRNLLAITLPELLYMGWQKQGVRYLLQGWFTGAVLTHNIRESVFVKKILKHVRARHRPGAKMRLAMRVLRPKIFQATLSPARPKIHPMSAETHPQR